VASATTSDCGVPCWLGPTCPAATHDGPPSKLRRCAFWATRSQMSPPGASIQSRATQRHGNCLSCSNPGWEEGVRNGSVDTTALYVAGPSVRHVGLLSVRRIPILTPHHTLTSFLSPNMLPTAHLLYLLLGFMTQCVATSHYTATDQ
jgi:hypothetical protein